jgi:hypothetical protein
MTPLDPGYEIPCDTCGEMRDTTVGPVDIDPPYSFCAAERCPVDVRCLRELEAQEELAREYLSGAMRACTVRRPELLEVLSETLAEALSVHYCEARIGYDALLARLTREAS